jgi:hypothetical protein
MGRTLAVTLNWVDGTRFLPDPPVLFVATGDTISFQLGRKGLTIPPDASFQITMDGQFFSPAEVRDVATVVTVTKAAESRYTCQLTAVGGAVLGTGGDDGGTTKPIEPPKKG